MAACRRSRASAPRTAATIERCRRSTAYTLNPSSRDASCTVLTNAGEVTECLSVIKLSLALQLHLIEGSESMGDHDSGFDDWWCVGRRFADAVGFVVARCQATHPSAVYAGAGRGRGGAVSRRTVG